MEALRNPNWNKMLGVIDDAINIYDTYTDTDIANEILMIMHNDILAECKVLVYKYIQKVDNYITDKGPIVDGDYIAKLNNSAIRKNLYSWLYLTAIEQRSSNTLVVILEDEEIYNKMRNIIDNTKPISLQVPKDKMSYDYSKFLLCKDLFDKHKMKYDTFDIN